MVNKISDLYRTARRQLMKKEDAQTAEWLARNVVCHFTGKTHEQMRLDGEKSVSEETCLQIECGISRLLNDEPLAYVLGEWNFYAMNLRVTPDVLIPRDDTCAVAELAIRYANDVDTDMRILDLCTGSGCIGLAVAKNVLHAKVTLADISQQALAVAKSNVTAHRLGGRMSCVIADALSEPNPFLGKFDMIVSNPPYITDAEMLELPDSVKNFEPHLALNGGVDGLDFYRSIASNYRNALKPGGLLCFEFGMGQADAVCSILQENMFKILECTRDYNQVQRAVIAQYGRKDEEYGYKEKWV